MELSETSRPRRLATTHDQPYQPRETADEDHAGSACGVALVDPPAPTLFGHEDGDDEGDDEPREGDGGRGDDDLADDDDWDEEDFDDDFDDDFEAELDEELERELAEKFADDGFAQPTGNLDEELEIMDDEDEESIPAADGSDLEPADPAADEPE